MFPRTLRASVVIRIAFDPKYSVANSWRVFCSSALQVSRKDWMSSDHKRHAMFDMSSSGRSARAGFGFAMMSARSAHSSLVVFYAVLAKWCGIMHEKIVGCKLMSDVKSRFVKCKRVH